ncbi:DUF211 domain-containing protein [Planococcus sp. ISL-109]|uniref:DUF211 domain-containing protein n=1 Tax=Planococcus sp. ISL-109 TaxID=2819166 RepID=UPI001BECB139|nr:DUF211 domain-containing protein [Planococcus sp. ISL-109]MBT2582601.1 hypothetical protein [Planococcus sp. ISL-109]
MKKKKYEENFKLEHGVKLYKEDLLELKKILEYDSLDYDNTLEIKFFYYKPDIPIRLSADIEDLNVGIENEDIEYLQIKKTISEKGAVIKSVDIVIGMNSTEIELTGDEESWLNWQRNLLEQFFARKESKSGRYNRWIINILHRYSSILAGILGGFGIGLENITMIIAAIIILITTAIITYSKLTHKLLPLNEFTFRTENIRELIEGKGSTFPKWITDGLATVFWGVVTYLIIKYSGM